MSADVVSARRLTLPDTVGAERVAEVASRLGGEQVVVRQADPEQDVPYQVEWQLGPFHLVYSEEQDSWAFRYLQLWGITDDLAELGSDLETVLEADLDAYRQSDLIAAVDDRSDPELRPWVLVLAGVGAPPRFDERFFTRICAGLEDEEAIIRQASLYAISWRPWSEYADPVARLLERENDPDVRGAATALREGFFGPDRRQQDPR